MLRHVPITGRPQPQTQPHPQPLLQPADKADINDEEDTGVNA